MALLYYAAQVEPPAKPQPAAATPPADAAPAARPAPAAAPAPVPEPQPVIAATPQRHPHTAQFVVIIVLLLALVLVVAFKDRLFGSASQTELAPETVAAAATTQPGLATLATTPDVSAEAAAVVKADEARAAVEAASRWSTPSGVRPAWADLKVVIEGEHALITAEGEAADQDAALAQALQAATLRVVQHLQAELRGQSIYELLSNAPAAPDAEVLLSFARQMGSSFSLARVEQAFKTDAEGRVTAVARFALPRDTLNAALELYSVVVQTRAATFATRFPTLVGSGEHDVVVVASTTPLLQPRDVLLSEDGRALYTLSQLREILGAKRELNLVVSSNSVAKPAKISSRLAPGASDP